MILYTAAQLELVLGNPGAETPRFRQVLVNGVPVLVRETGLGRGIIDRLLSTDPNHYLRPELAPGTRVTFDA